ncbi:MAG: hypothetical protein ACLGHM_09745 [Actinomycetes bacterium]
MDSGFAGYLVGTAIAAFAAALAAVAVGAWLNRQARRRDARTAMLHAISRHIDQLWAYASVVAQVRTAGAGNRATSNGQTLPAKPSIDALATNLAAVKPSLPKKAHGAVDEAIEAAIEAHFADDDADWQDEAASLGEVAAAIARWDGKAPRLGGSAE